MKKMSPGGRLEERTGSYRCLAFVQHAGPPAPFWANLTGESFNNPDTNGSSIFDQPSHGALRVWQITRFILGHHTHHVTAVLAPLSSGTKLRLNRVA